MNGQVNVGTPTIIPKPTGPPGVKGTQDSLLARRTAAASRSALKGLLIELRRLVHQLEEDVVGLAGRAVQLLDVHLPANAQDHEGSSLCT